MNEEKVITRSLDMAINELEICVSKLTDVVGFVSKPEESELSGSDIDNDVQCSSRSAKPFRSQFALEIISFTDRVGRLISKVNKISKNIDISS